MTRAALRKRTGVQTFVDRRARARARNRWLAIISSDDGQMVAFAIRQAASIGLTAYPNTGEGGE